MKKTSKKITSFNLILFALITIIISYFGWFNFTKIRTLNTPNNKSSINDTSQANSSDKTCITSEKYSEVVDSNAPVLSLPFDMDDFMSEFWGIVPFCADQWELGKLHNAIDFEVKPDSKIYAAADGEVLFVNIGEDEGAGDVIDVVSGDYKIDYSGLTNVQVKAGDKINKGDYLGDAALTPYGEYHLHLGISLDGTFECPIKYMDKEFTEALREMFAESHYPSESKFPCACNCENMPSNYRIK